MDTNLGRGMPSTSDRMKKSVDEFDAESKSQLVHFVVSAMSNICALICPKDPTTLAQRCAENIAGGYSSKDAKLRGNMKTIIEALPPKSLQRRVLLATVASSYSSTTLKADFGLSDHAVVASRKRFKCLQDGCLLNPDIQRLASYDKLAVQCVVCFVLNKSNVQRISWGTKIVLLDGQNMEFPKLV